MSVALTSAFGLKETSLHYLFTFRTALRKRRPLIWLICTLLILVVLFVTVTASALCFFVVTVSGSTGGTIEMAGITRSINVGNSAFVVPVFVKADSDFVVTCNGSVKRDGYITPHLNILVYVDIRGCDIDAYKTLP